MANGFMLCSTPMRIFTESKAAFRQLSQRAACPSTTRGNLMKTKSLSAAIALAGSLFVSQFSVAATATAVPAALTTNATALQSACTQLQADRLQLKINVTLDDAAAVAASQATVKSDETSVETAEQTLHTALKAYLSTDMTALQSAHSQLEDDFVQLKADVKAGTTSSYAADEAKITTDSAALQAADAQVKADHLALATAGVSLGGCGGGPGGPGGPHGHPDPHGGFGHP
jgi:hypothetical protein